MTEGDAGTVKAAFTVDARRASGQTVTVDYAHDDGTATAPADYLATSGTLTFGAGQTTKTVTVTVNADVLDEADETFTVTLSNPSNATTRRRHGPRHDHRQRPAPALAINDVTVTEGDAGTAERDLHRHALAGRAAAT